ncbi:unnamed protein product [Ceutorhynchus assimilis]|uniref:Rhythmically expressed gene 2 protein n=1 Tax=Ceutorhynchus assimilis TaxID=467358 RepID=A0A9N9QJP3_9CUCU|nr:unnamed protein product [Ceutorhynchus assimilis]
MNLSAIRLVTFDVTGTLLKLRSAPGQQYGEIGAMYGVVADNNLLNKNFKNQFKRMVKEEPNFGLKSGLGWESWWKTVIRETFKASKFQLKDEKLDRIADHLLEMYKTSACWQHAYGVPGILSYIRNKKIPMGVISNFDPRLEAILINTKLKHYFEFLLTSYENGFEKPDKRIFDLALEKSNLTNLKPEECLHIGDKPHLDYAAAKNAGWNAFVINDGDFKSFKEKYPELNQEHYFSSAYQLHITFLRNSGDKLSTAEQDLN